MQKYSGRKGLGFIFEKKLTNITDTKDNNCNKTTSATKRLLTAGTDRIIKKLASRHRIPVAVFKFSPTEKKANIPAAGKKTTGSAGIK